MSMDVLWRRQLVVSIGGYLLLLLGACNTYKSDFACKGYSDKALCLSATEVYARRHEDLTDSQLGSREATVTSSSIGISGGGDRAVAIAGQTENFMGQPNITQPQVLQVWIAPWRDAKNNLHEASVLYVKVQDGDWTYGRRPRHAERSSGGANVFTPHVSQSMFEMRSGQPGPNGGAPILTTPPAQPAMSAPVLQGNATASSDPSAILRQLQQNMPTVPGQNGSATSPGVSSSYSSGEQNVDPRVQQTYP